MLENDGKDVLRKSLGDRICGIAMLVDELGIGVREVIEGPPGFAVLCKGGNEGGWGQHPWAPRIIGYA